MQPDPTWYQHGLDKKMALLFKQRLSMTSYEELTQDVFRVCLCFRSKDSSS